MPDAELSIEGSSARIVIAGDWVVDRAGELDALLNALVLPRRVEALVIDLAAIGRMDTTGAWLLHRTLLAAEARGITTRIDGLDADRKTLFDAVATKATGPHHEAPAVPYLTRKLDALGGGTMRIGADALAMIGFFGAVMVSLAKTVRNPGRLRFVSVITHLEKAGVMALPIVCLISFLIGAIITQQGAFQLRRFGAEVFVVNLLGVLVLRELGLLLAAIMFAGRSGSAYTAEIGSMKMREEIDAMRVMGLDPIDILVVPRVVALIFALPLVTIVGNLAALLGGMLTAWLYVGIEPWAFVVQFRGAVEAYHLSIGLIKAPFMAIIIGLVACIEGMRVQGSTDSLGQHTTASVVKSIFMVIVVDGIFAMFFASVGW